MSTDEEFNHGGTEDTEAGLATGKIHTPRLARPEDAPDFVLAVREIGDAE